MRAVLLNPKPLTFHGGGERYALLLGSLLERCGLAVAVRSPWDEPEPSDLLILNGGQGTLIWSAASWVRRADKVWVIPHDSLRTSTRLTGPHWRRPIDEVLAYGLSTVLRRAAKQKSLTLIAVSRANAEELRRDLGLEPVCIPNGVWLPKPKETPLVSQLHRSRVQYRLMVAIIARWDPIKNPALILRLARSLPEGMGLLIISSPDNIYAPLVRWGLIAWPPLRQRDVMWLSGLESEELAAILGLLDFVLLPSRYEGFGYVSLEAAMMGVIPFQTPVGVGADLKEHPVLQDLVLDLPPHGRMSPAEAWERILWLRDEGFRERVSSALAEFLPLYSLEAWERRFVRLLEQTFPGHRFSYRPRTDLISRAI